jgi:hypothetical protein
MQKRIIICSDGTWNSPEKKGNKQGRLTNVVKMVRAIEPIDKSAKMQQVVFYDQGIGADTFGWLEKKIRGMTGWGIKQNILDCYRFLANNYTDGDEIYFIGFSRGAYTIRSLGGLLDTVGLLAKSELDALPEAYEFYRKPTAKRGGKRFKPIRSLQRRTTRPQIAFLGAFDTVGALGIPTPGLGRLLKKRVSFHNTKLSAQVANAYQALAIDERRAPFKPAIWTAKGSQSHVQQVWFAGTHSDIGGGSLDSGLSDIAFRWMIQRAMECGLTFTKKYIDDGKRFSPDPLGPIEKSFSIGYRLLDRIRTMSPHERRISQTGGVGEMIHESVLTRLQEIAEYRPVNLIMADATIEELLGKKAGHVTLSVHGELMQISALRQDARKPTHLNATLKFEGEADCLCEVVDLSKEGGARIRLERVPKPGQVGILKSSRTGDRKFNVIWSKHNFSGVQFMPG